MYRLEKTLKTTMRNMAFLMVAAVVLGGCGSEETGTREETQTVAEKAEQTAEVTEDGQENEEDVNGKEEATDEDGEHKEDEWRQDSVEPSDITGDNPGELNEYRLCQQELETENGIYILEFWMDQGIYGSVEEFGAGGGIYEENYIGKYHLAVVDENGEVLSKRELGQDFEEGDRMNFPGTFEIMVEDYNQDGCPDFTIGSYGSSSVNLYALYTIREDGKLDLLGKDILNCSPSQFSVAFEKGENGSFFGSMWDNAVGERMTVGYIWDEAQKKYVENENPDAAL